jgi:hypothetical protein
MKKPCSNNGKKKKGSAVKALENPAVFIKRKKI